MRAWDGRKCSIRDRNSVFATFCRSQHPAWPRRLSRLGVRSDQTRPDLGRLRAFAQVADRAQGRQPTAQLPVIRQKRKLDIHLSCGAVSWPPFYSVWSPKNRVELVPFTLKILPAACSLRRGARTSCRRPGLTDRRPGAS